jgi:hypothetical protein
MWTAVFQESRHMNYNKKIFIKYQEQEGQMFVELCDDATYLVNKLGSTSLHGPSGMSLSWILSCMFLT